MKNKKYTLGKPIPDKVRLEVYEEALKILNSPTPEKDNAYKLRGGLSLCLLLPCILWDLDDFKDKPPHLDKNWSYLDTERSFPEIQDWVKLYNSRDYFSTTFEGTNRLIERTNGHRALVLENAILKIKGNE